MSCSAQSVFERTMHAIGRPELIGDERFHDNRARGKNVALLDDIIAEWTARHTIEEAMDILVAHEAAAAPIYDVSDVVKDSHFQARRTIVEIADQDVGTLKMQAPTPRLSRTPGEIRFTGPHLGQHNHEIYVDFLGLSEERYDALRQKGVV
jgi:crotonobetainyl-CoA:carnitine CoA-transferase CaiB-like acyl-CoA transferase